jgi:hypothetical protein
MIRTFFAGARRVESDSVMEIVCDLVRHFLVVLICYCVVCSNHCLVVARVRFFVGVGPKGANKLFTDFGNLADGSSYESTAFFVSGWKWENCFKWVNGI